MEILEYNNSLDDKTLNNFEKEFQIRLPDEYRQFIIKYNGGYPEPDGFKFMNKSKGSSVDRFLGLVDDEYEDIRKYIQKYKDRIPTNLIPIAYDPGSNLVCISVSGEDFGSVYFWEHELEFDEGQKPDYSNVTIIANNFNEFLNGLYEVEVS